MESCVVLCDLLDADTAHTAYCISKIPVDKIFLQPDRLEDLRALVRLDRGDSHLRRDFDNPVEHCRVIIIHCRIVVLVQKPVIDQLTDGLVRQIRVDGTCAVTEQRRKVMYLSWLAALQDHGNGCPLLRPHQMLLESGHCQERRDSHMVLVHIPVCQDQDVRALADHPVNLDEQVLDRFLKACVLIICDRDLSNLEPVHIHILDLQKVRVCQDRIIHPEHLTVLFPLLEKVSVLSNIDRRGGDDLLTDRIDRRIRNLREKLFEISEQRLAFS